MRGLIVDKFSLGLEPVFHVPAIAHPALLIDLIGSTFEEQSFNFARVKAILGSNTSLASS